MAGIEGTGGFNANQGGLTAGANFAAAGQNLLNGGAGSPQQQLQGLLNAISQLADGGAANSSAQSSGNSSAQSDNPIQKLLTMLRGMLEKLLAPAAAIIAGRIVVTGGGLKTPRPLTANTWIAPLPMVNHQN